MNNSQELKQQLQNSVEKLYVVFEKYDLRQNMDYCDCGCISPEDFGHIFSNSLRILSSEDLERYSWKAMSTWGDSYDFRHFLPRLFELLAGETPYPSDPEIIFGKLTYGDWHAWDQQEQEAVFEYFLILWKLILSHEPQDEYTKTQEFLCAIGRAVDDVSPYLDIWENSDKTSAYKHLDWFLYYNSDKLPTELSNAFWESRVIQMRDVLAWLLSPHLRMLLTANAKSSTHEKKDTILTVIGKLETYSK